MKLLSMDGPVQKYGSILFDLLALVSLWLLLSLASLGLLLPAATASLYYAMNHTILREEGYAMKNFFRQVKRLFKRSLPVILVFNLGVVMTGANIWFIMAGINKLSWMLPIYTFILLEMGLVHSILFHLMGETELKFKALYKFSFILAHKHIFTSVICLVTTLALSFFGYVYVNPIVFIIAASFVFLLHSWLVGKRLLPRYDFSKVDEQQPPQ